MHALIWEAPRQLALRETAEPTVQPDEVVIDVAYVGICGSELSGYLGHNALRVPPLIMGHEFSGRITALGSDVATFKVGQAVSVNPMLYCGTCAYCQRGLPHLCQRRSLIGAGRPGGFAARVAVPMQALLALPESLDLRTAALVEPTAVAVRIGALAGAVAGETVLIIGAGPIGLLALQVLRHNGAGRVFVADLSAERRAVATALGGEALDPRAEDVVAIARDASAGLGAFVSIDAVGAAATRAQCVVATRSAGMVILSGLHEETSAFPAAEVIRRELRVYGSFCYTPANVETALALLTSGTVTLLPWTLDAPLADGGVWFERLINEPGSVAKVLLQP